MIERIQVLRIIYEKKKEIAQRNSTLLQNIRNNCEKGCAETRLAIVLKKKEEKKKKDYT